MSKPKRKIDDIGIRDTLNKLIKRTDLIITAITLITKVMCSDEWDEFHKEKKNEHDNRQ